MDSNKSEGDPLRGMPSYVEVPAGRIEAAQKAYAADREKWLFVLDTFWQYDYRRLLAVLDQAGSLDEAVKLAEIEQAGMIAT